MYSVNKELIAVLIRMCCEELDMALSGASKKAAPKRLFDAG